MRVSSAELEVIKMGAKMTYHCENGRQCESIRERCYRINRHNPGRKYKLSVSVDWKSSVITVEGVKKEEQPVKP